MRVPRVPPAEISMTGLRCWNHGLRSEAIGTLKVKNFSRFLGRTQIRDSEIRSADDQALFTVLCAMASAGSRGSVYGRTGLTWREVET